MALSFLRLTRQQISEAFKDPEAIRQVERAFNILRRLIAAGDGTSLRTMPFIPPSTLEEANVVVTQATNDWFNEGAPTGLRATITDSVDAASGNFAAIITGGGSETVPAWYDGVDWRIG
jgi:hypothetical protein